MVTLQLLRNATLVVEMDNKKILVDPMLGAKGAYEPCVLEMVKSTIMLVS